VEITITQFALNTLPTALRGNSLKMCTSLSRCVFPSMRLAQFFSEAGDAVRNAFKATNATGVLPH
jgi:hypothetical protein